MSCLPAMTLRSVEGFWHHSLRVARPKWEEVWEAKME
jgi:hypothetical protein